MIITTQESNESSLKSQTSGPSIATMAVAASPKRAIIRQTLLYTSVFALLLSIISVGYYQPYAADSDMAENVSPVATLADAAQPSTSVDEKTATDLAANFAMQTQISVAANVANLSTSLEAQQEIAQADHTVITKPQIVQPTADGRAVKVYVAQTGDTVQSIASEHNISTETVKWANDLESDAVEDGREIVILPVDGVMYTTQDDDTFESIAEKYGAVAERIVSYNDLEVAGLESGVQIIIPGGVKPAEPAPQPRPQTGASNGQTTGSFNSTSHFANASASVGNRYAFGNCTSYAYERRAALGRPIGSFWGNASTWSANAAAAGFGVDKSPAPGAIMQNGGGINGWGHVAIVETINPDGTFTVSEMNYAGFNVVSSRTFPMSQAGNYNFIH